jgi:hypothetical protein
MAYFNNYGFPVGYQPAQQQMQNTQQLMIRVSGEAEAWNYPMTPGATMMFTDGQNIYIKTTDNSPTGNFRFERFIRYEPQKPETPTYVTREEFDAFKASLTSKEAKTDE